MDANIISVPLKDCTHDLPAMFDRVNERTRLLVISNPNNPTGTIVPADGVERILDKLPDQCILLLDEAYYEYVDDPAYTRSIEWAIQGRNVLVLRTFSKIYGLAGLRIGYGIAPKHIIDAMERVRMPFNVNSMAQAAAIASLADPGQVIRSREQNKRSKEYFYARLARLGIEYAPTQANFIWIDTGKDSQWVFMELLKRGVIVRTGDVFGCPTHIRVTTGTDAANERFIATFAEVLGK
jgi:histidinol-phosphate aminotransferase